MTTTKFLKTELNEIRLAVTFGTRVSEDRIAKTLTAVREKVGWDIEEIAKAAQVDVHRIAEMEEGLRPSAAILRVYERILTHAAA